MRRRHSSRRLSRSAKKIVLRILVILAIVLFVAIGIMLIFIRMSMSDKDYSVAATLDNVDIEWQDTIEDALANPGDVWDYQCLSFEDNDLKKIVVLMEGQTSGETLNGSTSFSISEAIGVSDFDMDGMDFWYDLNETDFEVGEIVLVTVRFVPDEGDATVKYFSYKVCESQLTE